MAFKQWAVCCKLLHRATTLLELSRPTPNCITRWFSSEKKQNGLVLGVYYNEDDHNEVGALTPAAKSFNELSGGKLLEHLKIAGPNLKSGKNRVFYNLSKDFPAVAVVGLGKAKSGYNELEEIDERKETIRVAAAAGCRSLQNVGVTTVAVEGLGDAEAAAEGAALGLWRFQQFKAKKLQTPPCEIKLYGGDEYRSNWLKGLKKAEAQNLARRLADTPANLMTPTIFSQNVVEALSSLDVEVKVRDSKWAQDKKMGSFLSVSRGSLEPLVFLELNYCGGAKGTKPIVLVGKGVTFDSGGISLKPSGSMDEMRADMSGAACVVSTIYAVASLKLAVNVRALVPLCENMPSGAATKPGDVVTAMNGKTIQVDNTDAEGRLILADALCYAQELDPRFTLDIATLTGAMRVALGGTATGVFSNSTRLYDQLQRAGSETGDRVWRFPLWQEYSRRVTEFPSVDVNNVGKGKGGGSCTAAAFLKEFAPKGDWMHLDIASVMGPSDDHPYLSKGMTGRPTRTLIEFIARQVEDVKH